MFALSDDMMTQFYVDRSKQSILHWVWVLMQDSQSTPGIWPCNVHKATESVNELRDRSVWLHTKKEMLFLEPAICQSTISQDADTLAPRPLTHNFIPQFYLAFLVSDSWLWPENSDCLLVARRFACNLSFSNSFVDFLWEFEIRWKWF